MLIWTVIFVVSLVVLLKASDFFADSAQKIGIAFGIPPFIVGITIVAFATSLPELITSVISVLKDSSEMVAGNVVGSNVANIFLILGVTAILGKHIKIKHEIMNVDIPILISSAFLLGIFMWDGSVNLFEGVLLNLGVILYLLYAVQSGKKHDKEISKNDDLPKTKLAPRVWIILLISSVFIYLGATYTVESVIKLSEILNVAKEIVAISAIAIGTSLPELIVSISIIKKGAGEMALGNVLGSNIFNTFAVMGIPALIQPLEVTEAIRTTAMPIMIIATLIYVFMTQDKQITKWEGWLLIIFYIVFMGKVLLLF